MVGFRCANMGKRQRSIHGSWVPSGALCCCMLGFMLLKHSAGQASSSLKLRTGPVGPHEQAEVLRELQFIRRRYDEARQLLSADVEGDEHPLLVRRALRLLEANVRQWESIEPRARGSQSYDEGILLIAKNRAAIGDAYAKMGEIELALAELETSCPILWELQRSKRKPLGSMLASTLWSPRQAHSGSSHQPAVLAPSHGEQSMLKSVSSSSPGSASSAVDGSGMDTADSWLACYASLANLYTESQSQRDISDLHANAPWMGSSVAGNKVGRDDAVSQHALKLQTLAMISKLSILSGSQSEGSAQISVSKRVVWGEAKAMRTHLNEIVKQLTTISTADQGRTLYEKAQAWIQVTEADARRILDSLAERKAADVAAATAAPSTDDANGGTADDATQTVRLAAAATEASAAERALLLGELKREGAHYLAVLEGVLTEGWGYIDRELKRAADSVYYRSNLGTEGFQTRADVLRAFRSTLSEILAEKEALDAQKTERVAKQEPTNDVTLGFSGSALAAILGTLIVAVLAGWPSLKASRVRSRRVASLAAATRRQQQQQETNDTEGSVGNSTSGRRRTGSTDKTGSQLQQPASHDDSKPKRRLTWSQRLRAVLKTCTTFLRRLRRSIKSSVFSWIRFLRRRLTNAVARFRGALTSVGSALMFTFRRPVSRIDLFDEPVVKPVKTTKGGKGKASAAHERASAAGKKASRGAGVNSSSGKGKAQNQKPSSSSSALPPPRRTSSSDSISSASDVPASPSASDDATAAKFKTPPRPLTQPDASTKRVRLPVKIGESSKPQRKSPERKPLPVVEVVPGVAIEAEVKTEATDAESMVSLEEVDKAVPEVELVAALPEGKDKEPLEGLHVEEAAGAVSEVASVEPDVHAGDSVTAAVVVDGRVKEDEEESEEGRTTDEGTDEDLVDDDEDIDDAAARHLTEAAAEMEAVCEPPTAVMSERSASPRVAAVSPPSPTPEPPAAPTPTTSPRQHRAQASLAVGKPSSPRPTCKASSSAAPVRTPTAPPATSSRREHQQQHPPTAPSQQQQQRARAPKRSLSAGPGREPREDERYSHAPSVQPKVPSGRPKRPLRTSTSAPVPPPSSPPQTPRATPPHKEQEQQPLMGQQEQQQPIHHFLQQEEAQRQHMLAQSQMQQQPQPQPQPHPHPQPPQQQHHHHPHHYCAHPYAPLPPQSSQQQQQQHPSPQPPSEAGVPMAPTPTSTGVSTAMMGLMMPPPAPAETQNYTPPPGMRITLPSQGPPPPHPQMMMQPPIHMPIPSVGHPGYGPPPYPVAPPGSHSPAAFMPHPDWIYRSMSASPTFYSPPPPPSPVTREDLEVAIRRQIEYYFSVENLCKDLYLRSKMDEEGYVSLAEIANFNRVKQLTGDLRLIVKCVQTSPRIDLRMPWALRALEGGGDASMTGPDGQMPLPSDPAHLHTLYSQCKLRTREHPERWVQTQRPVQ